MRVATDGQLIEMVEFNGVWTPLWMVLEMGEGRSSERAGHEVSGHENEAPAKTPIRLPEIPKPKLLKSKDVNSFGKLGAAEVGKEYDERPMRN